MATENSRLRMQIKNRRIKIKIKIKVKVNFNLKTSTFEDQNCNNTTFDICNTSRKTAFIRKRFN